MWSHCVAQAGCKQSSCPSLLSSRDYRCAPSHPACPQDSPGAAQGMRAGERHTESPARGSHTQSSGASGSAHCTWKRIQRTTYGMFCWSAGCPLVSSGWQAAWLRKRTVRPGTCCQPGRGPDSDLQCSSCCMHVAHHCCSDRAESGAVCG